VDDLIIADLREQLAAARAELERVKAERDGFYSRMIAPQAQVTVGIERQIEKNASAKRFNAEVLTTLAAATSSLESLACNARLALFVGCDPIEVFSEVAGLATHLARRVADGTLPGEVPQASDVVVFACELDDVALASMTRWQAELAAWQARELPCDGADEQRWRLYAGVQEEMGEVARCLLKGAQDIRGGAAVWRAQLPGEIGDVLVYLTQLATSCGVDLGAAYADARAKVLARRFATAEVAK
jgi:NTP pyrophosphatase (non-canonical NTP hydrolase)